MDQATTLRTIVQRRRGVTPRRKINSAGVRTIAITSGKGGVGKSNTVLNLSMALSSLQRRVMLLDADMGLANLDVLLGLTPRYTLEHVIRGKKDISDVVLQGPQGLRILPSSSGISELSELSFEQQSRLFLELSRIDEEIDYLFIDTGAGISSNVMRFNASADEVIVVVHPEPTSITDAYALMKLLATRYRVRSFGLIANSVSSEHDGKAVFERLNRACVNFLQVRLSYLGCIPFDNHVRKAVRMQQAVLDAFPHSPAGKAFLRMAARIEQIHSRGHSPASIPGLPSGPPPSSPPSPPDSGSSGFWDRLLHWKKVK